MKKIILSAAVAAICFTSCNSGGDDTAKKNLEAARAITKAINDKQFDELDKYIAKDAIDHSSNGPAPVTGLDKIKESIKMATADLKDMKSTAIKELSDGEYVFQWLEYTGTVTKPQPGFPVGPFKMGTLHVSKMKDGKATEHWEFMQPADMMKMMMPDPAMMDPSKMDPKMKHDTAHTGK